MEVALDAGAEDVVSSDDGAIEVLTDPDSYDAVRQALIDSGNEPESADITMHPANSSLVTGDDAETLIKMLEVLEELDDVQDVFTNAEFEEGGDEAA